MLWVQVACLGGGRGGGGDEGCEAVVFPNFRSACWYSTRRIVKLRVERASSYPLYAGPRIILTVLFCTLSNLWSSVRLRLEDQAGDA